MFPPVRNQNVILQLAYGQSNSGSEFPRSDVAKSRRAIIEEMVRRKMSTNALAVLVARKVHRSHVYDFIGGQKELTTERANYLLTALGLEINRAELQ